MTKALAYLEKFLGPKGGSRRRPHANYATSIALMAFQEANQDGRYDGIIKGGQEFLKTMQWDESEGKGARRRLLRRGGLRRQQQPARPVEHRVHDRGPPRLGPARRRPRLCRRRWSSSRGARTSRASSTTSPGPARSTTAASFTPPPTAGRAWPGKTENGGLRSYAA